ncbi:hypothetical protein JQ600_09290 [Bradyrhizobium sp. AUGA SZCCT0176]|uniref:hypothetical protein n=1 Tax=Bradyrhizobium sp. AUGA SZCCT0176 TaxID=2807664 RepID=UPI001BABE387|nr:hypothetical protein [Bradyrhizobium sp. AUGA SZCCT0176]MBR1225110.1 hypothetical protein [Bradyrhizobium sp. AUGA SZCCT0176]
MTDDDHGRLANVLLAHKRYLERMTVRDLEIDHPLGFLHQTLLRYSLARFGQSQPTRQQIRETVFDYWASPEKRVSLFTDLKRANSFGARWASENMDAWPNTRARVFGPRLAPMYCHAGIEQNAQDERVSATNPASASSIAIVAESAVERNGILIQRISSRESRTVGATMFYCFAMDSSDEKALPLQVPVAVLANTLKWIAEQGLPYVADRAWPVLELRRDLIGHLPRESISNDTWFEDTCTRILAARNTGNILTKAGTQRLREMVPEIDVPDDVASSSIGLTDDTGEGWRGLGDGRGSTVDLVIGLADTLANLVAVRSLDETAKNLLRVLAWAFVPVNLPVAEPTGAAMFQCYVTGRCRRLPSILGDIFRLLSNKSFEASNKLLDVEAAAWLILREDAERAR